MFCDRGPWMNWRDLHPTKTYYASHNKTFEIPDCTCLKCAPIFDVSAWRWLIKTTTDPPPPQQSNNPVYIYLNRPFLIKLSHTGCALMPVFADIKNSLLSALSSKTKQTEEQVGRQHQGMERPGARKVPEGSGEQRKMEKTCSEIICGAPTTVAVKG